MAEVLVADRLIVKVSTGAASVETIWQDGAKARPGPHNVVETTGQFSLAGVLSAAQAAALSGKADLQGQVDALTASLATRTAELAALQAAYDLIKPPATIPVKAILRALAKLDLANSWDKAVELAGQSTWWWKEVSEVNPLGEQWLLIVAEMDKNGMWGRSSEAELLALADQVAGESAAAEPSKG